VTLEGFATQVLAVEVKQVEGVKEHAPVIAPVVHESGQRKPESSRL
jgi:hypothetical protein